MVCVMQTDCDVEWKFARTGLWMNYIDRAGTLPVPFNVVPTPKSCRYAWRWLRSLCQRDRDDDDDDDVIYCGCPDDAVGNAHMFIDVSSFTDCLRNSVTIRRSGAVVTWTFRQTAAHE